jgi:hypothetical protein
MRKNVDRVQRKGNVAVDAVKAYKGSKGIGPLILYLSTRR